jgi:serine O-acetyltransferase
MRGLLRCSMAIAAAPALAVIAACPARAVIRYDAEVWERTIASYQGTRYGGGRGVVWLAFLLVRVPEFRTLMLHRMRRSGAPWRLAAALLRVLYRPQVALQLDCDDIGPGLFIQHGFATIVAAERIGRDCTINQQVTIGWGNDGQPTLEDGVVVRAGAIVVGAITLATGTVVGAGAVVTRSTPAHSVVIGPAARVHRIADAPAGADAA